MNSARSAVIGGIVAAVVLGAAADASAQLDPLLFLKNTRPNVLLVVDTGNRMQRDAANDYYDPFTYTLQNLLWEGSLNVTPANTAAQYRRKYVNLAHSDFSVTTDKFVADTITAVRDLDPGNAFATFEAKTRLSVARVGLSEAIRENQTAVRFGLIKMRQVNPHMPTAAQSPNVYPVRVSDPNEQTSETGGAGKWRITRPIVDSSNGTVATVQTPLVKADAATANSDVLTILNRVPSDANALIPAGNDAVNILDTPVEYMLDDAKSEAARLIAADTACRNTAVVLVVGGGEGTTAASQNPQGKASQFVNVSGRRVPIYVVAIAPPAAAVAQLQAIATNSGGQYFEITQAMVDAVTPGQPIPEVVRAVNLAVQHTFASLTDFNTAPTVQLPYGPSTEYQVTSPIIGTVNLDNAKDISGASLPNSVITNTASGVVVPQRSNVMVTAGFAVPGGPLSPTVPGPGFEGRLRAFRVYKPVADSTKPSGWKFVSDGTRLWVARTPTAAEGARNIYTFVPGVGMIPFDATAHAADLQPYLRTSSVAETAALIDFIRALPLGAVVDSTPAIMDPPSLDPPPDSDYPGFQANNKDRRSLVWVGLNDGMLHAIDGRTGIEVYAFIPFNLLPKLRALRVGQSIDKFLFFADGSPKVADVKVGGVWRSYLIIGEGPGGTFYQALDVTLDGMATTVSPTSDSISTVLSYFTDPSRVEFKWSFPSYTDFDYTINYATSPYGDVKASASALEKSVGQTWSDPAVGQVESTSGKYVVLTGSGFLPYSVQQQANRGGTVAGTTFYMIDLETGTVPSADWYRNVGSDGTAETVDNCATNLSPGKGCVEIKNALQADPVATGPPDSRFITAAYIGDLDGRLWRLDIGLDAGLNATIKSGPLKLFDAGAAHPLFSSLAVVNVGGTQQYVFFGSGSDLLPSIGVSQSYKLYGVLDSGTTGTAKFALDLTAVDGSGDDEKVTAYPAVAGDIVFFTTTSFKPATPCTAPDANLYALTFIGGAAYTGGATSSSSKKGGGGGQKISTVTGARATAPFIVDRHLAFGAGGNVEMFGDPEGFNNGIGQVGVRILSWREVR